MSLDGVARGRVVKMGVGVLVVICRYLRRVAALAAGLGGFESAARERERKVVSSGLAEAMVLDGGESCLVSALKNGILLDGSEMDWKYGSRRTANDVKLSYR